MNWRYPLPDAQSSAIVFGMVAAAFGFTRAQIHARDRHERLAWARQVVVAMLMELTPCTTARASQLIGRDHSTVHYARHRVADMIATDHRLAEEIQQLKTAIQAELLATSKKRLVYLAVPYSDPDAAVRESRFCAANRAAAVLMTAGNFVFSPISHTHPIAMAGGLPLGWDYWEQYDRCILASCCRLIVLKLDGWNRSKGIKGECAIAEELGIEVEMMDPV